MFMVLLLTLCPFISATLAIKSTSVASPKVRWVHGAKTRHIICCRGWILGKLLSCLPWQLFRDGLWGCFVFGLLLVWRPLIACLLGHSLPLSFFSVARNSPGTIRTLSIALFSIFGQLSTWCSYVNYMYLKCTHKTFGSPSFPPPFLPSGTSL